MSLKLYLIRHGEYDGNIEHIGLSGRSDVRPLNPTGIVQARNVGRFFIDHEVQAIYCSPVMRAQQTAQIIANELGILPVTEERLTELSYGVLEGKTYRQIQSEYPNLRAQWEQGDRYTLKAPGGESFAELSVRVESCLRELWMQHGQLEGQIVIVTHVAVIHTILLWALGRNPRDILFVEKEIPIRNTSVSKINLVDFDHREVAYTNKEFFYPPKIIRNWLKNHYKTISDLRLYTGFSRSFVLSFTHHKEVINMKFYPPEDLKVAEKIVAISNYNQSLPEPLPIPMILAHTQTGVPAFPLALMRDHLKAETQDTKLLCEAVDLAQDAADWLHLIHAIPTTAVQTFWQSQEYLVAVSDVFSWKTFLERVTHDRFLAAGKINDQMLAQLVLEIIAWIKAHIEEIAQNDIVPLHGDYYPANWCINQQKITGIIDFDLALIGHRVWDLAITRQRSETYLYTKFSLHLEKAYGLNDAEKPWLYCYTLLEFIGSYIHNVQVHSYQQQFDLRMIGKYRDLLF